MTTTHRPVIDVRALAASRETIAYKDGGLFPVLVTTPGGTAVAVLRGGAGHLGLDGRLEIVRSLDGGQTWTSPNVVVDSDADDRNPALGVSSRGTLILCYARCTNYDDEGNWRREEGPVNEATLPWEMMLSRSHDTGLTWEKPYPLAPRYPGAISPYGKIVPLGDGTLLMPLYFQVSAATRTYHVHILRSRDDGLTWDERYSLARGMNETGLLVLPDGDVLAVMRSDAGGALFTARSADGGRTWSAPEQITGASEHPADVIRLSNGDVLLTYGNRNPPYRIEGRISRDGGRTWLNALLTFSGHLYGYTVEAPRPYDLGYPSSVVWQGQGITMYYVNPSLNRQATLPGRAGNEKLYGARDYYALAVTWSEAELIAAVGRALHA